MFRLANRVYSRCFPLYNPLYSLYKRISDRDIISWLSRRVGSGMAVADIGGNIGFYTALFSRLVGDGGSVHVFEPDRENFDHLLTNTKRLQNVVPNRVAVAERSGVIRLYRSDELNVDHQTYDSGDNRTAVEVPCVALDDYFREGPRLDFVKMDVQGYEYQVLLGMKETIRRSGRLGILSEVWPYGLHRAGTDPAEFLALLRAMGFAVRLRGRQQDVDLQAQVGNKSFYIDVCGEKG